MRASPSSGSLTLATFSRSAGEGENIADDLEIENRPVAEAAVPDDFGKWLVGQAGQLDQDFDLSL